jgi:hypothetical protein
MAIDPRIQRMVDGNIDAIIDGFISSSVLDNANAIAQAYLHNMRTKNIEVQLRRLSGDSACLFGHNVGYRISHFADAALHLLGFETYTGSDQYVLNLIESKFSFLTL